MKKKTKFAVVLTITSTIILSLFLQSCSILRHEQADSEAVSHFESDEAITTPLNTENETSELPDKYAQVSVSVTAAGDNLIHPNIYQEAGFRADDGGFDFKPMYEDVKSIIANADISFINQETLMAGDAAFGLSGYPSFNSPQKLGADLAELGFDIINIANNHMLDKGVDGLASTIKYWKSLPVTLIGAYENQDDAAQIRTIAADEITIAFLSYTYGTNGISLPASSELDIPYISEERIISDLKTAKEISNFIIVSIHWGVENSDEPTEEQRILAKLIAQNGADVILGHHSHTLLPLEFIELEDGRKTLCAYSLGNLVSAMMSTSNMVGGFLNFDIESDGEGRLCASNVLFTPTVFYYGTNYYGTHIYKLEDYNDSIAASHGTQIYGNTTTYEQAVSIVTKAVPKEFLPDYIKQ